MNKYKVIKIIKLLLIFLFMVLFVAGDIMCPGLEIHEAEWDWMKRNGHLLAVLGMAKNVSVDKNTVLPGESYTISCEDTKPKNIDESINKDHIFFVITRNVYYQGEVWLWQQMRPGELPDVEPEDALVILVPEDSISYTFSTSDKAYKDEMAFYHYIHVTNCNEVAVWFYIIQGTFVWIEGFKGNMPIVKVLGGKLVKLDISKHALTPGQSYTLSWNRSEGLFGYKLEVSEDKDFPPEKTTTIYQGNNTSYTASAPDYIPEETWYYFRVRNNATASPWSNVVSLKIDIEYLPLLSAPVTEGKVN